MGYRTHRAALIAAGTLAVTAAPAAADYYKVADPTRSALGKDGGVVVGVGNGERTAELGLCTGDDGRTDSTDYYYGWAGPSSHSADAGQGAGCSGDAPAVVTGTATDGSAPNAVLHGTINPHGRSTSWYFEWGTNTEFHRYDNADYDAGWGWEPVAESYSIGGLKAGVTYYFRLVASSAAGTTYGPAKTFTVS
jgi:hypothetical protein